MKYMDLYREWLEKADPETVSELEGIRGNEEEIEDRFYKFLEFGTAGLRGVMGAGTNRMNKYVLIQATRALADVIIEEDGKKSGVVIAHDCRINSRKYAKMCAALFASAGIKTYLFEALRPTPELSFAIRELGAISGINITASHNPQEYNGYKVYWKKGSQILSDTAERIQKKIAELDMFPEEGFVEYDDMIESGLIHILGKKMDDRFIEAIKGLSLGNGNLSKDIKAVFTPLNGTGGVLIPDMLRDMGYENLITVDEQMKPDGRFPTTPYPNPEDFSTFKIAIEYAEKHGAELAVATDPDADRIAIAIRDNSGRFVHMNGNQTGALLLEYYLGRRKELGLYDPKDAVVTTIVTGDLGKAISRKYGLTVFETLTGFKHVCQKANEFEITGEHNFVFGYEESIGYCPETFTRDKDAVSTAMLIFEMAAYYKAQGRTLYEELYEIYEEYGHYREKQFSIVYKGMDGAELKQKVMNLWRAGYPESVAGEKLEYFTDYLTSEGTDCVTGQKEPVDIPESDVLKFRFDGGTWYAVRPSGTEPKLKVYIYTVRDNENDALSTLDEFESELRSVIKRFEKEDS